MNALQLKNLKIDELKKVELQSINSLHYENIIDVKKITKSLTLNKIKQISIAELNPNLELNQLKSNTVENSVNLESADNEIESESNDGLHGLNDRKKNQKLSLDKVLYIKIIYESTSLTNKEFQSKFNISYSVLNKIKQRTWNQINSIKRRKIVNI